MRIFTKILLFLLGLTLPFVIYGKGWVAGEKYGRIWGEINGRYRGMADMTRIMSELKVHRG